MKTEIKPEEVRLGISAIVSGVEIGVSYSVMQLWLAGKVKLYPIPLTEEKLIEMGFERLPHKTVTNSLIKNIGRNRHLSIGDVGTPNLMLWLCAVDNGDNPKEITDLVCLHNWDYDKEMYVHQMQNLIFQLTQTDLIK